MYDDYDLDYTYSNDYASDLDEDYARDGQDYQDLAYRHYAWYNLVHLHNEFLWLPWNAKYKSF